MENSKKALNAALKVGQEKHILDLQKNGTLYCNTIKYFREIEKTDLNRHDGREGAFKTEVIENPEEYKFTWNGKEFPGKVNFFRFNKFDANQDTFKLFCLFGFKKDHVTEKPFIKPKMKEFGPKALFIKDLGELIRRVGKRLNELEINFKYSHVNYYEESGVNKNLSVFDKPNQYSHQSEFRFLIKESSPTPFSFQIGSIEDISVLLESEKLSELRISKTEP